MTNWRYSVSTDSVLIALSRSGKWGIRFIYTSKKNGYNKCDFPGQKTAWVFCKEVSANLAERIVKKNDESAWKLSLVCRNLCDTEST